MYRSSENWHTRIFFLELKSKITKYKILRSIWLIACINNKYNNAFPSVLFDTSYFAYFTGRRTELNEPRGETRQQNDVHECSSLR